MEKQHQRPRYVELPGEASRHLMIVTVHYYNLASSRPRPMGRPEAQHWLGTE